MYPSLIEIGSKTAEKNCTDKQTDTTKIMVSWPWTNNSVHVTFCQRSPSLIDSRLSDYACSMDSLRDDDFSLRATILLNLNLN